jgi:hypothetical protein
MESTASPPALRKHLHTLWQKRWVRISGIAIALILLLLIALPFFINVNSFRPRVESEASSALGRQVTVGNLSLSLLSGSLGVDDISIADDPAFGKSPFVTAKSLKVGVKLIPLLLSKQVSVTGITNPSIARTGWPPPRHENLGDHLGSVKCSSCLHFQLFGIETCLLFPKRDLWGFLWGTSKTEHPKLCNLLMSGLRHR